MPVILPKGLPARDVLIGEGADVVGGKAPLNVALVNLMPHKIDVERQFARLFADCSQTIDLSLLMPSGHQPKHTDSDHIRRFYRCWEEVADTEFDGLIVTGAPVELLPFGSVDYWRSLTALFDWADDHVGQSHYICWAAQAALFYRHGIMKRPLPSKAFGVFAQKLRMPNHWLVSGMDHAMTTPVSRHTTVDQQDIDDIDDLVTVAASDQSGPCLVVDGSRRASYMFNHLEYEADTLAREYRRDHNAGLDTSPPANLDLHAPSSCAGSPWRRDAQIFFSNWAMALERRCHVATLRRAVAVSVCSAH